MKVRKSLRSLKKKPGAQVVRRHGKPVTRQCASGDKAGQRPANRTAALPCPRYCTKFQITDR